MPWDADQAELQTMHDPPYITELYDFMMELVDEHDPDDAAIKKRDAGPAIVLEWDGGRDSIVHQYDDFQAPPGPPPESTRR